MTRKAQTLTNDHIIFALRHVRRHGRCGVPELAEVLNTKPYRCQQFIGKLQGLGLFEESDFRKHNSCRLTDKGIKAADTGKI